MSICLTPLKHHKKHVHRGFSF